MISTIGIWIAALFTLMAYSFLYKDNPVYRFAEYAFVGASAGYSVAVVWNQTLVPNLVAPLKNGDPAYILPLVLSIMMLMHLVPKLNWLSRIPLALAIGVFSALAIRGTIQGDLFPQIGRTILPLNNINNIVIIVCVLCTIYFFHFTREQKGPMRTFSLIGRYSLMIFFGASFGFTVMSRLSILIGRVQFLIYEWLGTLAP